MQHLAKLGIHQRAAASAREGEDKRRKARMEKQRKERVRQEEQQQREQARLDKMQAMAMKYGGGSAHQDEESSEGDVSENEWD